MADLVRQLEGAFGVSGARNFVRTSNQWLRHPMCVAQEGQLTCLQWFQEMINYIHKTSTSQSFRLSSAVGMLLDLIVAGC